MKTITLSRRAQGWMATFKNDAEVLALFGTDTLPTSYTTEAETNEVVSAIQRLNPDAIIKVSP